MKTLAGDALSSRPALETVAGARGTASGDGVRGTSPRGVLIVVGTIDRHSRGDLYDVTYLDGGTERRVLCKRMGRMVLRRTKLWPGDRVRVELSPYDTTRGRVIARIE